MPSYTFGDLQDRVADEINDSSNQNVSVAQVKKAIVSAVEHYERQRMWFNEIISTALVTVANAPAVAVPTDIAFIERLQISTASTFTGTLSASTSTVTAISSTSGMSAGQPITGTGIPSNTYIKSVDSSTQITMGDIYGAAVNATASGATTITLLAASRTPMDQIEYSEWSDQYYSASGSGQPSEFAYYQDSIFLYPTPNAVYGLILSYCKRLTTLSADNDTNGWTTHCEPLIRNRAKWDIFKNLLYLPELAASAKVEEMDSLSMVETERAQRGTTGHTTAYYL